MKLYTHTYHIDSRAVAETTVSERDKKRKTNEWFDGPVCIAMNMNRCDGEMASEWESLQTLSTNQITCAHTYKKKERERKRDKGRDIEWIESTFIYAISMI